MTRTVYHVTTIKKLRRYVANGRKSPPTNAWLNIDAAERFAAQTHRRIILRLKIDEEHLHPKDGHRGEAVFTDLPILFPRDVV